MQKAVNSSGRTICQTTEEEKQRKCRKRCRGWQKKKVKGV